MVEVELTKNGFDECVKHDFCVVDFFAEWCMPCMMMSPVIEDLAERFKKVNFAKINIDDTPEVAEKLGVMSIPCLIFFKKGKEVERLIGMQPEEVLEEKIKSFLK